MLTGNAGCALARFVSFRHAKWVSPDSKHATKLLVDVLLKSVRQGWRARILGVPPAVPHQAGLITALMVWRAAYVGGKQNSDFAPGDRQLVDTMQRPQGESRLMAVLRG